MSHKIVNACWDVQTSPTVKAVLISLADNASDDGSCWPSIATICRRTCLSEKSVRRSIAELERIGLLLRSGSVGAVSKYTITPVTVTTHPGQPDQPTPVTQSITPVSLTSDPGHTVHNHGHCDQQNHKNHQEPSKPKELGDSSFCGGGVQISVGQLQALGVEKPVASEYLALRKRKKANLTPVALDGLRREATAAGMSLGDAMRVCVENGWQGFKAEWVQNRQRAGPQNVHDRRAATIAALTGRDKTEDQNGRTIDVTPEA